MVTGTRCRKVGVWWCGIVTTSPVAALECEELNTVMMKGRGVMKVVVGCCRIGGEWWIVKGQRVLG